MGLINWVVGILEVAAPVLVAPKKAAKLSIAVVMIILVLLLVFCRHRILPNSVVRIWKIWARTLVANAPSTTLSVEAIKLNDSVYQLHKPEGDPMLQVLFFHGLLLGDSSEMHLSTWQSGDGSACIWPKTWLAKDFPDAQILAISYAEGLEKGSAQSFHMHNISENLINDFMLAGIGQQPYCPVVLVGHSFGGLVIKELCVEAHNSSIGHNGGSNVKKFLENLRGIFYYGTPHQGSPHMDKAERLLQGPLFKYFKSLSIEAAMLNYHFNNLPTAFHQNLQVEGLGEGRKVQSGIFKDCVVVPEASARDGDKFNLESTADHFSICRPKDKTSRRFTYLTTLLHNIDEKMKEEKKDHSGKMDHLVLYRPGNGTIWIVKNNDGVFSPVYPQGDPRPGIGGYNLLSPADRVFAYDYDHSGKMDHIALYRPGTGTIWILKNTDDRFSPVYKQGDPGSGIGGYNLLSLTDRVFAYDYDHSGKMDHLVLYRPGTGTIWILKNTDGRFSPVYKQGDPGSGIGGYNLLSPADRVFAYDYDHSGKMDHIALYRPGTGTIWILKNTDGGFSPVYRRGDPGSGIGGYDLLSPTDRVFAYDYDHSGKMDHLVLYRPGTGTIWILKNTDGGFSPVYRRSAPGSGIGGYNLLSPTDRVFAYDYDHSGKMDHLVLYRPGTGTIWILKNTDGGFSPVYRRGDPGSGIGGYELLSPADRVFAYH